MKEVTCRSTYNSSDSDKMLCMAGTNNQKPCLHKTASIPGGTPKNKRIWQCCTQAQTTGSLQIKESVTEVKENDTCAYFGAVAKKAGTPSSHTRINSATRDNEIYIQLKNIYTNDTGVSNYYIENILAEYKDVDETIYDIKMIINDLDKDLPDFDDEQDEKLKTEDSDAWDEKMKLLEEGLDAANDDTSDVAYDDEAVAEREASRPLPPGHKGVYAELSNWSPSSSRAGKYLGDKASEAWIGTKKAIASRIPSSIKKRYKNMCDKVSNADNEYRSYKKGKAEAVAVAASAAASSSAADAASADAGSATEIAGGDTTDDIPSPSPSPSPSPPPSHHRLRFQQT